MLFAVVYHPPPDSPEMKKMPKPYQLTRKQLVDSLPMCKGLPVTYEHGGIHEAVQRLQKANQTPTNFDVALALETSSNAAHRTLGFVTDAFEAHDGGFWAILSIDFENKPGLYHLMESGMLQSVSLTHMIEIGDDNVDIKPLEIALVGNPARPGCRIRFATKSALNMELYKASLLEGTTHTIMSASSVVAASATKMETDTPITNTPKTCEEVLKQMSPESRALVADRLAYLVQCMDKQKAELVAANKALASKAYDQETDNALLKSQIAQLWAAMDETAKQNLAVPSVDALSKSLSSNNANEMRQNMLKTIMCCNLTMMQRDMNAKAQTDKAEAEERKKVRIEPTPEKEAAPAPEAVPLVAASKANVVETSNPIAECSKEEALKRALTEAFEM